MIHQTFAEFLFYSRHLIAKRDKSEHNTLRDGGMHTQTETCTGCHNSTMVKRSKKLPGSISACSVKKKKKKRLGNNQMKEKKADMDFASKKKKPFGERQGRIKDRCAWLGHLCLYNTALLQGMT